MTIAAPFVTPSLWFSTGAKMVADPKTTDLRLRVFANEIDEYKSGWGIGK
jgi:hypothetical protein